MTSLTTTLSTPGKPDLTYTTSVSDATDTGLYALLIGHIAMLQKELDTLEILLKRKKE